MEERAFSPAERQVKVDFTNGTHQPPLPPPRLRIASSQNVFFLIPRSLLWRAVIHLTLLPADALSSLLFNWGLLLLLPLPLPLLRFSSLSRRFFVLLNFVLGIPATVAACRFPFSRVHASGG